MKPMIELKLPSLQKHLKKSYEVELQEEHQQLAMMLKVAEREVPVFVGILHNAIVQMIAYLPYEMKKESAGDIARFLHHLNKELDVPGFGMDENAGLIFYRVVIPCLTAEVDPELIEAYIKTLQRAVQSVLEGIEAVQSGDTSVARAAKVAQVAGKIQPKKV